MVKISFCSLAYNSAFYIPQTIGNMAPYADEICVLVDDRTTDNSRELIAATPCSIIKIEDYHWLHDFSKAKNTLIGLTGDVDWIIFLEDDDKLTWQSCKLLTERIREMPMNIGGILLPRKNHYPEWSDNEDDYMKNLYPDYHMIAFRKFKGLACEGRVHEGFGGSVQSRYGIVHMDDINRHHHAWKGSRESNEALKHYYCEALRKVPNNWNPGDELPEDLLKPIEEFHYEG